MGLDAAFPYTRLDAYVVAFLQRGSHDAVRHWPHRRIAAWRQILPLTSRISNRTNTDRSIGQTRTAHVQYHCKHLQCRSSTSYV